MNSLSILLWCLPEVVTFTFIIIGPLIQRTFFSKALHKAAADQFDDVIEVEKVNLVENESKTVKVHPIEKAKAVASYYLDFYLAVIGFVVLPFVVVKYFVVQLQDNNSTLLAVAIIICLLSYFLICLCTLYVLFTKTNSKDYLKNTEQKLNVFGVKKWRWGRVSGTTGIIIWWARVVPSLIGLTLSIRAGLIIR